MLDHERASIVDRILSGVIFFRHNSSIYKILNPSRETIALADFLASEASSDLNFSLADNKAGAEGNIKFKRHMDI